MSPIERSYGASGGIPIFSIGDAAAAALRSGAKGHVLALFQRSLYVRFEDGRLLCLGGLSIGRGPLNALVPLSGDIDLRKLGIASAAPVVVHDKTLSIFGFADFGFANANRWSPVLTATPDKERLRIRLNALARAAADRPAPPGFAVLVPWLVGGGPDPRGDDFLRAALPSLRTLSEWLANAIAGRSAPCPSLKPLIGLGPGLTPSGDDYLCGCMTALHAFGRADIAKIMAKAIPDDADTNVISLAHLRCAAYGQAGEVMTAVVTALSGGAEPQYSALLDRVDQVGHSSGWDGLAGVVAAFSALLSAESLGDGDRKLGRVCV